MNEPRFEVRFDQDAYKEYERLDNSVVQIVDNALEELEKRADEVGKILTNKQSNKLYGCKEIKLRDAGIRIVFRVTNETVDVLRIVYIITIEKRADDMVFRIAAKRFRRLRVTEELHNYLANAHRWQRTRLSPHLTKRDPKDQEYTNVYT